MLCLVLGSLLQLNLADVQQCPWLACLCRIHNFTPPFSWFSGFIRGNEVGVVKIWGVLVLIHEKWAWQRGGVMEGVAVIFSNLIKLNFLLVVTNKKRLKYLNHDGA